MTKTLIILAVGLAIGILLASTCNRSKQAPLPPLKPVQTIIDNTDKTLLPRIDSLKKNLLASEARNLILEGKLQAAQQTNRQVATKALKVYIPCDTANVCNDAIVSLVEAAAHSDSACNEKVTNLNGQLLLKGSLITAKDKQIAARDTAVSNAIDNQAALVDANKVLKKRNFWQRLNTNIYKYTTAALAVVVLVLKFK